MASACILPSAIPSKPESSKYMPPMKTTWVSPIGTLLIEGSQGALSGLHVIGHNDPLKDADSHFFDYATVKAIDNACRWLDAYFNHQPLPAPPPLHLTGTAFQLSVWRMLLDIPYGQTTTYGIIARRLSPHSCARAVGQAVKANPIAIIIPCHRVLSAHGLGGYAYGLTSKRQLLACERTTGV